MLISIKEVIRKFQSQTVDQSIKELAVDIICLGQSKSV